MTDLLPASVRDEELHRRKYDGGSYPQSRPQTYAFAGITCGDTVDVLLVRGGMIGATYKGTRSSELHVFELADGRLKGFWPEEIVLVRRAS